MFQCLPQNNNASLKELARCDTLYGTRNGENSRQTIENLLSDRAQQTDIQFKENLTLQRGVTGTARMLHALTHSSISRQVREQM